MCITWGVSELTTRSPWVAKSLMVKIKILVLENAKLKRYLSIGWIT